MTTRLQLRWTVVPWFRPRLRVPPVPGEAFRIERVIAAARLLLTLVTFIQLDRTLLFPREYIFQAEVFLITFAVYGLTAMTVLRTRQRTTRAFALTTHAIDLVAAVAVFPVAAPPSPFFVLFLFVLASAAFRWGLRETFATNLVAVALVFIHAALTAWWPPLNLGIPYDLNRILLRGAYLSMIGLFLGYLAEESRLLRSETVAIAGILGRVRADAGAIRVLTAIAAEVESLFNAKKLLLAVENQSTGRAFRWDSTTGLRMSPAMMPADALGADEHRFLFGSPNETLALARKFWRRVSPLAVLHHQARSARPARRCSRSAAARRLGHGVSLSTHHLGAGDFQRRVERPRVRVRPDGEREAGRAGRVPPEADSPGRASGDSACICWPSSGAAPAPWSGLAWRASFTTGSFSR